MRKVRPGRFTDLTTAMNLALHLTRTAGPDAPYLFIHSGPQPRSGRFELAPGGLYAWHVRNEDTPQGQRRHYATPAQAFLDAALEGRIVETGPHWGFQDLPGTLALAATLAEQGQALRVRSSGPHLTGPTCYLTPSLEGTWLATTPEHSLYAVDPLDFIRSAAAGHLRPI